MKKTFIIAIHIGFWLCYSLITVIMVYLSLNGEDQTNADVQRAIMRVDLFAVIPSIISFYSFYFIVFQYLQKKRFLLSIIYAITIAIGASLIGTILIYIFLGIDSLTGRDESLLVGIVFITFVDLVLGIVALVTRGFITWYKELKLKEELKQKNHEMEMALVKSQLDPHFLFNTLNNIDILILKNANEASNYLNKLSDIMRFMLFETKADRVSLSREIEYIEKYIALQKIRTSNSNYIHFEVIGSPVGQTIAPMVFLPFIENAFKHTTNKKLDNAIKINIIIMEKEVEMICENKFNPNRKLKQESNGLGNDLIEKRLKLIYPDQHDLQISKNENQYRVRLKIIQ